MTPEYRIIWDEGDRIEDTVRIFELGLRRGVQVVLPGAGADEATIAREILFALGKDIKHIPIRKAKAVEAARIWLEAERIRELVVVGVSSLEQIERIVPETAMRVWVVTRSHSAAIEMGKKTHGFSDLGELFQMIKRRPFRKPLTNETQTAGATAPFPRIPFNDFLTFIPACKRMYPDGPEMTHILKCFREELYLANRALRYDVQSLDGWKAKKSASLEIKAFIHRQMLESTSIREAVCRLRAIQSALFSGWIFVRANLLPLLALVRLDDRHGDRGEISVQGRTRVDATPGFMATLAHTSNLTAKQVTRLEKRNVKPDGSLVKAWGENIDIPPELQVFVRAHLLQARASGSKSALLFHTANGNQLQKGVLGEYGRMMLPLETPASLTRGSTTYGQDEPQLFHHLEVTWLTKYESDEDLFASL